MSNYTKGKWELDMQDGSVRANGQLIAQVYGATEHNHEDNATECFANARLILNAPEMCEALRHVLDEIPIIAGDSRHDALSYAISNAYKVLDCIDGVMTTNE